jgi:hypothetical protein
MQGARSADQDRGVADAEWGGAGHVHQESKVTMRSW